MSKVTRFRRFQIETNRQYHHQLQEKGVDSWWVFRSETEADGSLSPFGRVVFFARSREQAEGWMARQQDAADPGGEVAGAELALSA